MTSNWIFTIKSSRNTTALHYSGPFFSVHYLTDIFCCANILIVILLYCRCKRIHSKPIIKPRQCGFMSSLSFSQNTISMPINSFRIEISATEFCYRDWILSYHRCVTTPTAHWITSVWGGFIVQTFRNDCTQIEIKGFGNF